MLNYLNTKHALYSRGVEFSIDEYLFCVNVVLGEDVYISYALVFDKEAYSKVADTDEEREYLLSKHKDCDFLLQQPHIIKLKQELNDIYLQEIQSKALQLKDYRFTGVQIAQILQNLLHNRIADLDTASTKDVISLIKILTEQFGFDDGSDFERHFIQIYPKFNALCTKCNREFQIAEGVGAVCPHCGATYAWNEENNRFIPQPAKL